MTAGGVGVSPDILHHAAGPNGVDDVGPFELPWIAECQPIVWELLLPAVADLLLEETVPVANAVADCRQAEARHAVHETSREPAKAAVAETGIRLERAQLFQIDTKARERLACRLDQAEIDQRVVEQPSNEIFNRQVIDPLLFSRLGPAARIEPAVNDAIPHRECRRHEPVVIARAGRVLAHRIGELCENSPAQLGHFSAKDGRRRRLVLLRISHSISRGLATQLVYLNPISKYPKLSAHGPKKSTRSEQALRRDARPQGREGRQGHEPGLVLLRRPRQRRRARAVAQSGDDHDRGRALSRGSGPVCADPVRRNLDLCAGEMGGAGRDAGRRPDEHLCVDGGVVAARGAGPCCSDDGPAAAASVARTERPNPRRHSVDSISAVRRRSISSASARSLDSALTRWIALVSAGSAKAPCASVASRSSTKFLRPDKWRSSVPSIAATISAERSIPVGLRLRRSLTERRAEVSSLRIRRLRGWDILRSYSAASAIAPCSFARARASSASSCAISSRVLAHDGVARPWRSLCNRNSSWRICRAAGGMFASARRPCSHSSITLAIDQVRRSSSPMSSDQGRGAPIAA